jgi:hypothetical protein
VALVLVSLERGSRQHVDVLDGAFDLSLPIYCFCREENVDAYNRAIQVREELLNLWQEGNGALKRLINADSWALKSWRAVETAPVKEVQWQETQTESSAIFFAQHIRWSLEGLMTCLSSAREERVLGHQRRDVLLYTKNFAQLLQVLEQRQQDGRRLTTLKVSPACPRFIHAPAHSTLVTLRVHERARVGSSTSRHLKPNFEN